MISIIDSLKFVLKNMLEKKKRVFLTISGIIIGIFVFTFFIFVAQGLSNAIYEQFSAFGVNDLGVQPATQANGPPGGSGLTKTDISKIKQVISNYNYIAGGIGYSGQFEYGREKQIFLTISYEDDHFEDIISDLGVKVGKGRLLRAGDSGSIFLGYKLANELFKKEITVGSSLKIGQNSFRVIGIGEERGDLFIDNAAMINFEDAKKISGQDTFSFIRISFLESADLEFMKNAIENKLNPRNKEKVVNVTSPSQAMDKFNQIIGILTMIISFVSGIALVVGGINVMNTMYSNILERINEISTMKAIGATNSDIRNLFLIESSILGFIGAIIGFLLSYGLAEILSSIIIATGYNVPIYFDLRFFITVILITSFFAMIFGTYPAMKASKIQPADNLRDE